MLRHQLPLVLLLCAAACVGDDDQPTDSPPSADDGHASISASVATPDEDPYDPCQHLPADPPCSLLCDPAALAGYVPESSCAVFVCVLTDGRQVSVHACHPPS